jgi:LysR family hydrogen peroxide-inducible transcriptional activator
LAQARATLAAAAGVSAAADAARDPFAGELRLGVITTVAPYLLPIALPGLAEALPQTPLYLVEDLTDRLLARLRDGALDAAVIATDPRDARLASIELYDEPFFLVFSGHTKKRGRVSIGVEEIDPSTLLLLAEGHCLRDQALALCKAAERTALGADVRGTSLETLRHLALAGQGATLAPLLPCVSAVCVRDGLLGGLSRRRVSTVLARLRAPLGVRGCARGACRVAAVDSRRGIGEVLA